MLHMKLSTPDTMQGIDNAREKGKFKHCNVYTCISHNITVIMYPYKGHFLGISKYIYVCKHIIYKEKTYRTMAWKLSRMCIFQRNVQTSYEACE